MPSASSTRAVAMTGANQVIRGSGPVWYKGITIRETAGAVAVVRLWDNPTAASGTIVAVVSLAAAGSYSESLADEVWCDNGLFLEKVSGTIEGSVRIA